MLCSFFANANVTFMFACQYKGAMTILAMIPTFLALLLVTQRNYRFNLSGASGGNVAGHEHNCEQEDHNKGENERISWPHRKQQASKYLSEYHRTNQPDSKSDASQC